MSAKTALRVGGMIVLAALWAATLGQLAQAQSTYTWSDAGTDWATAANWNPSSGTPGGLDTAEFVNTVSYANAPNIAGGTSVPLGGLWVTGAAPLAVNGSAATLTLNGATINGNANTGIEMDPGAGAVTLNVATVLARRKPG